MFMFQDATKLQRAELQHHNTESTDKQLNGPTMMVLFSFSLRASVSASACILVLSSSVSRERDEQKAGASHPSSGQNQS